MSHYVVCIACMYIWEVFRIVVQVSLYEQYIIYHKKRNRAYFRYKKKEKKRSVAFANDCSSGQFYNYLGKKCTCVWRQGWVAMEGSQREKKKKKKKKKNRKSTDLNS
eukprot:TRINITY_DN20436_c0_g1_i1.p3 TRINITY_DN20436_c0_g1~~TRINITY_DN20436_c0_g1_i1.p3  ORF type:complete len:107 (-),score=2.40 TRINITY_DN20436_c0_g1_i1:31-351(-)